MRFDDDIYGYNPYGLRPEKAEGGIMNIMRSTLMVCVTIIISVAMTLLFMYSEERFNIIKGKDGIFVFDKKTTALNYCDDEHCILISNKFHHHKKMSSKFSLIPPKNMSMVTSQQQMMPMPQQQMMAMPQQQMVAIPMYAQPVMPQAFVTKAAKAAKKSKDENNAPSEDVDASTATDDGSVADATASDNRTDDKAEQSPQQQAADNSDADASSDEAPAADAGEDDNTAGSDAAE